MIVSSETENQPAAVLYAVAAELFFALGDPARLRLLALLETGECNVSQIAGALGEEMSTVSQRLKLLRFHGLVARRRQGKHIYYSLADAHVAGLIRSGLQHAAEGAAHG
jgi:DNA-binding transcriptional ArsR family regulator